jgi:aminoglycoside phosphotransferase (APT) family kinase protein
MEGGWLRGDAAMAAVKEKDPAARRLVEVLSDKVTEVYGVGSRVENLVRLSGGASRETWSFDAMTPGGVRVPLILKRDPLIYQSDGSIAPEELDLGVSRATEGKLMDIARRAGVPVPEVPFYLMADERTSEGFVMERLEGETLGRRILREDAYARARPKLAFQCGHAAARLHSIPVPELPELMSMDAREEIEYHREQMSSVGHPYPGFEYGFRWLEERLELAGDHYGLAHGDFRVGNFIIDGNGLRGVLDFELAHLGNPISDLGWICVRSWRYGHIAKPVGGFGEISDLQEGYEAGGGGKVSAEEIHYWEVFGTLRWGILCLTMAFQHINSPHVLLEKAAIGRRSAETEYDLLQIID